MSSKPRILCLHGGGVTAKIFELQMRYLIKSLAPHFRLVFADGPWLSEMHEDLKPVYSHMGPCRRWSRWLPHQPQLSESSAIKELEDSLMRVMDEDEGIGAWVGLLGFSQGAKLAFSILLENQLRVQNDRWGTAFTGVFWQFGIIMAGRALPFNLSYGRKDSQHYAGLTQISQDCGNSLGFGPFPDRLRTPTLHVHGLRDSGLSLHQTLLNSFTCADHTKLVEWDGAHRIPLKSADIKKITEAILEVAKPIRLDNRVNLVTEKLKSGLSITELSWTDDMSSDREDEDDVHSIILDNIN